MASSSVQLHPWLKSLTWLLAYGTTLGQVCGGCECELAVSRYKALSIL